MKICRNCYGQFPCWCSKPNYIEMWNFVVEAFKRLKG